MSHQHLEGCGNGLHSQKEDECSHAELKTDVMEFARKNESKQMDEECLTKQKPDLKAADRLNEAESTEEKFQLEAGLQTLDSFIGMSSQIMTSTKTNEGQKLDSKAAPNVQASALSEKIREKIGKKEDDKYCSHVDIGLRTLGNLDLDSLRETEIIDVDTSASSLISGENE
jgi:hypothetical protein